MSRFSLAYASLLPLLLASVLSSCAVFQLGEPLRLGADDWATEGGTATRSNATEQRLALPLEAAWRHDADGAFGPAAALAADGLVIVTTRKGEVRAVDLETGRKRTGVDFREPLEGTAVLTGRRFYATVAAGKRTILGYDFVKGERVWSLRAGPHEAGLLLAETPSGNLLVAAGTDGTVRALDPADGSVRWSAVPDSAAGFFATPALLAPGMVAVADDRGRVTALDLASGTVRWTEELGGAVYETPTSSGDLLLVPTTQGRLVALGAASGTAAWTVEAGNGEVRFSTPAADNGLVVVGASDGILRALDAATGTERWRFRADGNFGSAPLLTADVVFAGAYDEMLYALDRATGEVLWDAALDGRVKTTPVLHDGTLLVLAEPRHIHAFRPASPVASTDER